MADHTKHPLPWRTGRKVGRTIYDAQDELIGVMDTPELADRVVQAVNGLGTAKQADEEPAVLAESARQSASLLYGRINDTPREVQVREITWSLLAWHERGRSNG